MFGFLHLRAWPVLGALVAIGATMVLVQNARWFGAPFTFLADVFFRPAVFFYVAGSTIGFGVCVK